MTNDSRQEVRLESIVSDFQRVAEVEAITLAGSITGPAHDNLSDYDLYVYSETDISVAARRAIARKYANRFEVNNQFWETGDEWQCQAPGRNVDIMYRRKDWVELELDRVLVKHQASVGYSTCIWYNVLNSQVLYDEQGWFNQLQSRADCSYPEDLRRAIIAKNFPILRQTISSYFVQINKAVKRNDLVSVNHRVAAFLASYFDILLALNRRPHPGEKRLVEIVKLICPDVPSNLEADIARLISAMALKHVDELPGIINGMIDDLENLPAADGLW